MKNKIINFLFILVFILSYNVQANSTEFVFESEYIEFKNSGNIIEAKNGVKITSDNEIEITADESLYNKLTLELILKGNVVFIDVIRDIKIQSQEATYNKNTEKIIKKRYFLFIGEESWPYSY